MVRRRVLQLLGLAAASAALASSTLVSEALAQRAEPIEVKVAVAANFTEPIKEIAPLFEKASGNKLLLSFGATGQFYAQITQGAPFDILLAADQATPAKAVTDGHAVAGSPFTYAIGKLVLFSKTPGLVDGEVTLKQGKFAKIAIANPAIAPYGAAGVEVMKKLGVYAALAPKIVQGNSIAQTYRFIDTSNAEVGFVALSQVAFVQGGSRWLVPSELYTPIAQDAVLLKPGTDNKAAYGFLAFLKSPEARAVIEKYGYGIGG